MTSDLNAPLSCGCGDSHPPREAIACVLKRAGATPEQAETIIDRTIARLSATDPGSSDEQGPIHRFLTGRHHNPSATDPGSSDARPDL